MRTFVTVRPGGHPFARSVVGGPRLEARLRGLAGRRFVIVDEGPGLSGSSFGGVADWLESLGIPRRQLVVDGAPMADVPAAHLADYLSFRRERFPADRPGAALAQLLAMARHNLGLAAPEAGALVAGRWSAERVQALQAAVEPVHVDARLHWWEWLRCEGRILKTDAIDHSEGHDLVGCQDILWDVAGATVELVGAGENERGLADRFVGGAPARRELLRFLEICYLAFQLGWWSMSATPAGSARGDFYRQRAIALLA